MNDQLPLFTTQQKELTSDDWYTPKFIFDALDLTFDIDVACPHNGPWHTPTNNYYTQETDGLSSKWSGRVFMNPPYSKPSPWVNKWINHGNGIALMVMTKSHWFESLWTHPETAVIYMRQIKFERPGFPRGAASSWSYGLWAIGSDNIEALEQSKLGRVR
jgi:phage N-6-adenine-methyltransferase